MKIYLGDRLTGVASIVMIAGTLVACGTVMEQSSAQSPKAAVAAAEAAIAAAGQVALPYMALPPCGGAGAPALCSSATIKANIKTAYDGAYTAATTAQGNADAGQPVDTVALNAAVSALETAVAALPKQGK